MHFVGHLILDTACEDIDAFNERLKEVLFNEQSGLLETWSQRLKALEKREFH